MGMVQKLIKVQEVFPPDRIETGNPKPSLATGVRKRSGAELDQAYGIGEMKALARVNTV
jgi:hypothetical protein